MPNRVIRCGLLDSDKFNSLNESEQNFFVRLMLVADDYGRFDARPEMLKSHCYPVSDKCLTDVSQMSDRLATIGMITLYDVNNKKYLQIINFDQRLRQLREKYPPPPCQTDVRQMTDNRRPESESELNPKLKGNETEAERKGIIRGRETNQYSPKRAVSNLSFKIKAGIPLTEEEARQ